MEVETKGPRDTHKDRNGQLYAQTRDKRGTRVDRYIYAYIYVYRGKRGLASPRLRTKAQGRVSSVTEASPLGLLPPE